VNRCPPRQEAAGRGAKREAMDEWKTLLLVWHDSYRDVEMAFEGLRDEHVHTRIAPGVMAISEMAAHLARSEASITLRYLLGKPAEAWRDDSVLLHDRFGWPPDLLLMPVDEQLARMSADEVKSELLRVHAVCYQAVERAEIDLDTQFDDGWHEVKTARARLLYAGYHVPYHVGQIYMVRHVLGDSTPDN
jgi:hypothetical protein